MPSNQRFEPVRVSGDTASSSQSRYTFERNPSYSELSPVESIILRSTCPLAVEETEEISVLGQRGIWLNKSEEQNWHGPIPISEYQINEDPDPEIIVKQTNQNLVYIQELAIRYLKPPTPAQPGDIIIRQESNSITTPAPPLIIRQQPPRPPTPDPLVVREAPPEPPKLIPRRVITISGQKLPPPPRKVIIERLAPLPSKPQPIIIERWLPYSQPKRRVVHQRRDDNQAFYLKPKNVIVQWQAPEVTVKKDFKYLGIIRANPSEYVNRYGSTLKSAKDMPDFVLEIKPPNGIKLASEDGAEQVHQLEGDVEALKYVDLEKEGLSEYRSQLEQILDKNSMTESNAYYNKVYSSESVNKNINFVNSMFILNDILSQIDVDRLKIDQAERLYNKLCMRMGRLFNRDEFSRLLMSAYLNQDGTISLVEFKQAFEALLI
ncbi:hypothetical protein BpHYR1_038506 [Brachionus plicatilis]|uniref:EF-hand domain-containing protein n=1 Tax=Brachionus plicatilis TaxID=10195 RepID=A0A3M7PEQ9_BRAPC|nr:hypothetical protein BpHYR1_038506 [Brachionus plicatilis]